MKEKKEIILKNPLLPKLMEEELPIYLSKIVSEHRIDYEKNFDGQLKKLLQTRPDFKTLNKSDLGLDGEDRYHEPIVEIQNSVIMCSISLQNSIQIKFKNCIILGNLTIGDKTNNLKNVTLDNCIIKGRLNIVRLVETDDLSIISLNASDVNIRLSSILRMGIHSSRIFKFELEENIIQQFMTYDNDFSFVKFVKLKTEKVYFDYNQINYENLGYYTIDDYKRNKKYLKLRDGFNLFLFRDSTNLEQNLDNMSHSYIFDTINFIEKNTTIRDNKDIFNKLKYYKTILANKRKFLKYILRITGALLKPIRILFMAIILYSLFTLIYLLPISHFSINEELVNGLDVMDSLYFSGTTFTTIGYGEIVPVGITKLLSVFEGFLGIIVSSAFLVSLTRKYL
ncbi:hypothetical protein HYT53_04570 [Candidatus Woesearchaeota archaeon]|nr:hypothetical protein [Candidatus Woesearchaeota archaeon]